MLRSCLLAVLLTIGLTACGDDGGKAVQVGGAMAPFTTQSLDGRSMVLPDQGRGQVIVLRFWATWCAFCKDELKAIEPIWQANRDRGLLILAVNAGQSAEVISSYVRDLGISYPVLLDDSAKIARQYGVTGLPTTYFIDRQGQVRGRLLGESDAETFRRKVEELL